MSAATAGAVPADVVRLRRAAVLVLTCVGLSAAVLSFANLAAAAEPAFGGLSWLVPVAVDLLIAGSLLAFVAGARAGHRPRASWRLAAHLGAGATLVLNLLAASPDVVSRVFHVAPAGVWVLVTELLAAELVGDYKAEHVTPRDRIPLRLWLASPVLSVRTALHMSRTGVSSAAAARVVVGVHAAASEALRMAVSGPEAASVRRVLERQLRAGSLDPVAVLAAIGWTAGAAGSAGPVASDVVLRLALTDVLAGRRPIQRRGVSQRPSSPAPTPVVRSDLGGLTMDAPETTPRVSPGTRAETPRRSPAKVAPAESTGDRTSKRDAVLLALVETAGSVDRAVELLAKRGTPVSARYAYRVKRDSAQLADQGSAQLADQGSAQLADQGSAQLADQGSAQLADQGSAQLGDLDSAQLADRGSALVPGQATVHGARLVVAR